LICNTISLYVILRPDSFNNLENPKKRKINTIKAKDKLKYRLFISQRTLSPKTIVVDNTKINKCGRNISINSK